MIRQKRRDDFKRLAVIANAENYRQRKKRFPEGRNLRENHTSDIHAQEAAGERYPFLIEHEESRQSKAAQGKEHGGDSEEQARSDADALPVGKCPDKATSAKPAASVQKKATPSHGGSYRYRAGTVIARRQTGVSIDLVTTARHQVRQSIAIINCLSGDSIERRALAFHGSGRWIRPARPSLTNHRTWRVPSQRL